MQNSYIQSAEDEDENSDGLLKLFVGGLNYLSLQSDIKSYFETFGKVQNCTLLIDKTSGKSRGFAFVSIEDITGGEVQNKILTRKHEINGKIVDVKLAVEGKKREEMLDSSKKIFVGGLDPTVTNDDLRNFFSHFGLVREAVVLFDNNRGASRCFGFVTFESKETVDSLVKNKNYIIKGKQVEVKQAQPKANQKNQNITCQSGVDIILNNNQKNKNMNRNFEANIHGDNEDYEDKKFIDMVTNPGYNSKEYYMKFQEKSGFGGEHTNNMFGNVNQENMMYNSYMFSDMNSRDYNKKFSVGKK